MSDADPEIKVMTDFAEALQRSDPVARATFLDGACEGDPAHRGRVEALIAAHAGASRFLEPDPAGMSEDTASAPLDATGTSAGETGPPGESVTRERRPDGTVTVGDQLPSLVETERLETVTSDLTFGFTPSSEPLVRTQFGEFRILRRVGQGGMGVVYEAVQESLGRHVALKLLPPEATLDPKRLERFRREARAAARLHHTNIVPVFGVGEAAGRYYYAMQFISGHPLDAVIDEMRLKDRSAVPAPALTVRPVSAVAHAMMTGTFTAAVDSVGTPDAETLTNAVGPAAPTAFDPTIVPPPPAPSSASIRSGGRSDGGRSYCGTVARLCVQVAEAMAYAHGQGILHRDIKPANLLLDLQGTVWVTDFGLAKSNEADDLTSTGDVIGTLRYMAPERFEGSGDHRADVYALGLTLYELLTLKPAFAAENRARLVERVIAANPPKPRSLNPAIPRDLETVVLKAIARDPALRYQSASELADDLRRFTEDRPIRARRASSTEAAYRWCRRNPAVASLLAAVLVVFAAGTVTASYFALRAESARQDAESARGHAELRRSEAQEAREREASALLDTRRKVVRLDLATGGRFADAGNLDAGLLWYARAWDDDPDPESEPAHRLRLGLALQKKPTLVGLAVHDEPLADARIDDAGGRVLTQTRSGKAALWDIRAGRVVTRFDHSNPVTAIALSRDGLYALTGGADGLVRIWKGRNGDFLRRVDHGAPVASLEWQRYAAIFATVGGDPGVRFWRADGSPVAGAPDAPGAYHVEFSGGGKRMVTATTNGLAQVWESDTGKKIGLPLPHRPRDEYELVWNLRRGPILSPDGKIVLTSTGEYEKLSYALTAWEVDTGRQIWRTEPPNSGAYGQRFSPGGNRLLLVGLYAAFQVDPATGVPSSWAITPRECQAAVFLGTDRTITASTGGLLQVWNTTDNPFLTGETVRAADTIRVITALPDGNRVMVAAADGTARLYDFSPPPTEETFLDTGRSARIAFARGARLVTFSPDGKRECEYGGLKRVQIGPRDVSPLPIEIDTQAQTVSFSLDGTAVLAYTGEVVRSWDASQGKPLGPAVTTPVGVDPLESAWCKGNKVASANGKRVVVSERAKRQVRVIDMTTGKPLLTREYAATEETTENAAVISRDGQWLATGDFAFAGAVEIWDIDAGKKVVRFDPHRGNLRTLDFSADGTRVLVCSTDTTARLWDARKGRPLGPVLRHSTFCQYGELAGDGRRAAVIDFGNTVHLWDAITGDRFGQWQNAGESAWQWGVWFSADGQTLYHRCANDLYVHPLRPLTTATSAIPPLLELTTGQRIDSATEGVEFLRADIFISDPERYLAAFRESK